ncbi:MAG: hypothetical protein EHM38_06935 [Geobacteraceae bacterium]|nr:MAG: hypothetical protein EHM38_06935 [Geobacteraceae bacterium]
MVQLKYFGDDRDYFKYDLITAIVTSTSLRHYVFVPMLTEHRYDNEGNKLPKVRQGKRDDLLAFIGRCRDKNLKHWERWLAPYVASYRTVEPVGRTIFSNETRASYWLRFHRLLEQENTLAFLDPDTGLQLGRKSAIREQDCPKYILDTELEQLVEKLHPSSALLIYQHLPRNMHWHKTTVNNKIVRARERYGLFASAYREGDLAFIALTKSEPVCHEVYRVLAAYHRASGNSHKSFHPHARQ